MLNIAETAANVESGHACNHNGTRDTSNHEEAHGVDSDAVPSAGDPGAANSGRNIVDELRALLGTDVVLLPVIRGDKKPVCAEWQQVTVEKMADPAYLDQLSAGNIGVLLGPPSNGLCAIDIDSDELVDPFLALNPRLATTLRTKGARGCQIWVRIQSQYPKLARLKTGEGTGWGEWRADGGQSVIYGRHKTGVDYQFLHEAQPIEIGFDEIVWPDTLKLPWVKTEYDLLVEKYGAPFELAKGTLHINDMFFTAYFQGNHKVLWEESEQEFYAYDEGRGLWERITEEKLKYRIGQEMLVMADKTELDQFRFKAKDGTFQSLANTLKGAVEVCEAFTRRKPIIHVANGMLDLTASPPVLKTYHPDYYSRNACPIALDPEAQCPRFMNDLLGSALDADDIKLLQVWAGSVLVGGNAGQKIMLVQGTPGGGKSTLIEVIEKIIGTHNVAQIRTKQLNDRFELQKSLGKTLLTGKDVNANFMSEDGAEVLKALVGNDLLDAEKKGVNKQFQMRGNFAVAITCNSRLHVRLEGDVGAWRRRLMLIDYTRPQPTQIIANFADQLIGEEGPGILNWMIEGAVIYLQQLKDHGTIQLTETQRNRVNLLLAESDSVRNFVIQCVERRDGENVSVAELQAAYFEYCDEMGWRSLTSREFGTGVSEAMLEIRHVSRRNDIRRGVDKVVRGFSNVGIVGRRQGWA